MIDWLRHFIIAEFLVAAGFMAGLMLRGPGRRTGIMLYGFGTSYLLLICLGIAEVTLRLGKDVTWRTPLAAISATVAVVTMVVLYRHDTKNGHDYFEEGR